MTWKAIGHSAVGTSHTANEKGCDDAVQYSVVKSGLTGETMICCASDGAGSAIYASLAADMATKYMADALAGLAEAGHRLVEADIYALAEELYDLLEGEALKQEVELNEFSCTLLGCYVTGGRAIFFQIGDGAIVRNDGAGNYAYLWWPHNGEYQNTTSFVVDDRNLQNLRVAILEEQVDEVAIFTDGLQLLALNTESETVHQPFFTDLFKYLRMADEADKVAVLNRKLAEYLDSRVINDRTDDDKTLFLATRLQP